MAYQSIGFVGLGNLGLPMVANLVEQGWHVIVQDSDPGRMLRSRDVGGVAAKSLSEIASCNYVCLVVPDTAAVNNVVFDQGLIEQMHTGSVLLVHSTVLPSAARSLAEACAVRGVAFLDAPVSGGAARARSGELTIMVGGSSDDLGRARVLLAAQSSELFHVGEAGAGSAVKLANQLMLFSALAGAYEALDVAKAYGVSEDLVLQAVAPGTGSSWVSENWGFYDKLCAEYDEAQVAQERRPWSKDLKEVVRAAGEVGLLTPLAALLSSVLPPAVKRHAEGDVSTSAIGDR